MYVICLNKYDASVLKSGFISFPDVIVGATGESKTITAFWWDKKTTAFGTHNGFKWDELFMRMYQSSF